MPLTEALGRIGLTVAEAEAERKGSPAREVAAPGPAAAEGSHAAPGSAAR